MSGSGTEIFAGANTYSGGTTLTHGTLGAASPTAFGTGSFTNSGGTLELADGNHTLEIGSTFTQGAGGTTLLSMVNGASNDQIVVANTAALGGNLTVNLSALSQPGTRAGTIPFTLLTSRELNNTAYATTTFLNAPVGSNPTVSYTPDDVLLDVTTSAVLFPATSLNGNQQGVLGAINRNLTGGNISAPFTALDAALANLYSANPGAFGSALDQLSPLAFGQFTESSALNNASFEIEAMDGYLAGERGEDGSFITHAGGIDTNGLTIDDPAYDSSLAMVHSRLMAWNPAPVGDGVSDSPGLLFGGMDMKEAQTPSANPEAVDPWNVFVRGNVVLAQGFSDGSASHFDDNTESVAVGADYRLTSHFLAGALLGYAHTDVTLDDFGSSATVDSYSPGIYLSYADRGWYANFVGDYIHNAYTQDRVIGLLGQTARSAPEGDEGVVSLDGGYDFHHGAFTFGPLAGLQYTHLTVNGYQESGSVADLSVNDQQQDSLRSRLGGRVSYAFSDAGILFTPHLDASWQHEFLDQSRGITSQFDFGGGSFAVQTANPSRDSALLDLGLDADLNRTIMIFADYELQAGQSNYFGQSIEGGVKIGF
jgi:autotransporter-associated beta strand protein